MTFSDRIDFYYWPVSHQFAGFECGLVPKRACKSISSFKLAFCGMPESQKCPLSDEKFHFLTELTFIIGLSVISLMGLNIV